MGVGGWVGRWRVVGGEGGGGKIMIIGPRLHGNTHESQQHNDQC